MTDLPSYDDALAALLSTVVPDERVEHVPLDQAPGRVLAEAVIADRDQPPFDRSAMDGYALSHAQYTTRMPVVGTLAAGMEPALEVPAGSCIAIATGAALPPGLDTVIPHEQTDRGDPVTFTGAPPVPGMHVHRRGADTKAGSTLVETGARLSSVELALAATVGATVLGVRPRPRLTLLTSGDEIITDDQTPLAHQIRNSNGPMIASLAQRAGADLVRTAHLEDSMESVERALRSAMETSDIIVTTGGISAGDRDFIPGVLDTLGCTWSVAGVHMQPGRPVRGGRLGEVTVVCLPGNPVSTLVCGSLLLVPVLRARGGDRPGPRWRPVTLARDAHANPRREAFRPAHRTGPVEAEVPPWQGSGDLCHAAGTSGLVRLPPTDRVPAGTSVPWTRWP